MLIPQGAQKAAQICRRVDELGTKRSSVEWLWRNAYDVTFPIRGAAFSLSADVLPSGQGMAETYGKAKQTEIYDSTAPDSVRVLSSGMVSGLTPANSIWFELDVGLEGDLEKRWLGKSAGLLWENIHNSNFDAVGYECMTDASICGQFVMFIPEEATGFEFIQWPLANCFGAASRVGGPIDTTYYRDDWPLEQVIDHYGVENVSPELREKWVKVMQGDQSEKRDQPVRIVIAIYPRPDNERERARDARFGHEMPWASCHVEVKTKHIIRESGFMECPVIWPRWYLIPGSVYATGPVNEALPDIKTINEVVKLDLMNLDLAVGGMWGGVDDGVLNPRSLTLGSRKVIVMRDKDSFFSLQGGNDVKAALLEIDRLQRAIRRVLMADQLEGLPPPDKTNMTAYEVHVRMELLRQILGPVYGRFQAEYLAPLVRRCFGIAYRHGLFGRAPRSIGERLLQVRYISPIARAQKLVDVAAMDRYETTLAQEAKVVPDVLDNYDWDGGARKRAELLGVPADLIPDRDAIAAQREQRAKAKAAEAMIAGAGRPQAGTPGKENIGLGLAPDLAALGLGAA